MNKDQKPQRLLDYVIQEIYNVRKGLPVGTPLPAKDAGFGDEDENEEQDETPGNPAPGQDWG